MKSFCGEKWINFSSHMLNEISNRILSRRCRKWKYTIMEKFIHQRTTMMRWLKSAWNSKINQYSLNEVCCMFPYTTFNNERNFIPFLQSQFVLMMNVETFNKQSKIFEVNICSFSRRLSTFSKFLLSHCRKDVQSMVE